MIKCTEKVKLTIAQNYTIYSILQFNILSSNSLPIKLSNYVNAVKRGISFGWKNKLLYPKLPNLKLRVI